MYFIRTFRTPRKCASNKPGAREAAEAQFFCYSCPKRYCAFDKAAMCDTWKGTVYRQFGYLLSSKYLIFKKLLFIHHFASRSRWMD